MIIVTLLALILHLSFVSLSPMLRLTLNLPLLVLVTWSLIDSLSRSMGYAVGAGIILDIYSEAVFGVIMVSMVLAVLGAWMLYRGLVSNRSFYGYLALILSATVIYWSLFWGSISLLSILNIDDLDWSSLPQPLWLNFLLTLGVHSVVAFLVYQLFSRILKSFRRHFLPITKTKI